ncbi:MAG: hypothetical protein VKJ24_02535 [Synechococcales bacterium]|nr:hypothetical protein [Synechococcales bacterium]
MMKRFLIAKDRFKQYQAKYRLQYQAIALGLLTAIAVLIYSQISQHNPLYDMSPQRAIANETQSPPVPCHHPPSTTLALASKAEVPLYDGLDHYRYSISTRNAQAQRYFNQGLLLSYGFNHAEAARSFREAARLQP